MPIDLSFSQLLAVMAQVERYALSGGLEIARPEASTRLVFDRGVLLHAEMTRARGRITKGPTVLDELIGRHQGTLAWVWPGEREEAPAATITKRDTTIFRRSLKMLVRYGYFDDPQAAPVNAEFFGVPEEALSESEAEVLKTDSVKSVVKLKPRQIPTGASEFPNIVLPTGTPAPNIPMPVASVQDASTAASTVEEEPELIASEASTSETGSGEKAKDKNSGSRSVIANPQTALGKLVFNKALRIGGHTNEDENSAD